MSRTKIPFPVRVPFVESLGLELHACAHGASELRVDLADAHMNSWEVAHGGVLMTMLDVAMATAARSDHLAQGRPIVGVVRRLRPAARQQAAKQNPREVFEHCPVLLLCVGFQSADLPASAVSISTIWLRGSAVSQ